MRRPCNDRVRMALDLTAEQQSIKCRPVWRSRNGQGKSRPWWCFERLDLDLGLDHDGWWLDRNGRHHGQSRRARDHEGADDTAHSCPGKGSKQHRQSHHRHAAHG